jgi:hypothetical protein
LGPGRTWDALPRSTGMTLDRDLVVTEFTAPVMKLEDFVRRPEWAALPMKIQLGVVHLWRTENHPPLTADDATAKHCGGYTHVRY